MASNENDAIPFRHQGILRRYRAAQRLGDDHPYIQLTEDEKVALTTNFRDKETSNNTVQRLLIMDDFLTQSIVNQLAVHCAENQDWQPLENLCKSFQEQHPQRESTQDFSLSYDYLMKNLFQFAHIELNEDIKFNTMRIHLDAYREENSSGLEWGSPEEKAGAIATLFSTTDTIQHPQEAVKETADNAYDQYNSGKATKSANKR